jgi:hypothetical protein
MPVLASAIWPAACCANSHHPQLPVYAARSLLRLVTIPRARTRLPQTTAPAHHQHGALARSPCRAALQLHCCCQAHGSSQDDQHQRARRGWPHQPGREEGWVRGWERRGWPVVVGGTIQQRCDCGAAAIALREAWGVPLAHASHTHTFTQRTPPDIEKVVDTLKVEDLPKKAVICRCWRSEKVCVRAHACVCVCARLYGTCLRASSCTMCALDGRTMRWHQQHPTLTSPPRPACHSSHSATARTPSTTQPRATTWVPSSLRRHSD